MSRIDSQVKHQDLFGQKKDSPPGLWDPLAGLFKKKVPPSIPEEPVIALPVENIPNGINEPILEFSAPSKVPVSEVSLPLFDEVSAPDFRATPEVPILDAPRSLKENVEILPPVGAESEIQTIAINAIEDTPMNTDAVIKATITTLTPIANPQTLPVSFSRKASSLLTLRNFSYLALLITAISFIYFLYTKLWKKNPPLVEEIPTINQPVIEEKKSDEIQELSSSLISEEVIVEEEKVVPTESQEATTGQKITAYEWLNPSQGVVGGIIGGILGFFLSKFTEQRNSKTFQEKVLQMTDLRYAQFTNQYVTQDQLKVQISSISPNSNLSKEQQALSKKFDEISEKIQEISNQLNTSGKPRCIPAQSDLQNQLSDSQNGTNVKEQYEKIEQTISQLESRFNELQESQRTEVLDLRKKLETLLSKEALEVHLESIRKERNEMFAQLRQEINAMQEKAGSKDGEQVRHLQELKDQLGRLASQMGDFNPKDLLEKFDQLKAASSKNREEAISQLKQVVQTQITENRNSILAQLDLEISKIQKSEGSKNETINRELQALKEQLDKLSSLRDFDPKELLAKFEQLTEQSEKQKVETLQQLKQEIAVKFEQAILHIRQEFDSLNIENREEISALAKLVEQNFEFGFIKFEEIQNLAKQLRSQDNAFVMKAIDEQNTRFDTLQEKTEESISKQLQEIRRELQVNPLNSPEVLELLNSRISQLVGPNSDRSEKNGQLEEMTFAASRREFQSRLNNIEEQMKRGFINASENDDRLDLTKADRTDVLKQRLELEKTIQDLQLDISGLRREHNNLHSSHRNLDSRFMRSFNSATSPDNSPNKKVLVPSGNAFGGIQQSPQKSALGAFVSRNSSNRSISPGATKDSSSDESIKAKISEFRQTHSSWAQSEHELTEVTSRDVLTYLTGRGGGNWANYGLKKDQDRIFIRTDKVDLLAVDFLSASAVTTDARKEGQKGWSLIGGLHSEAVHNLSSAESPSLKQLDLTLTPDRARRKSISSNPSKK